LPSYKNAPQSFKNSNCLSKSELLLLGYDVEKQIKASNCVNLTPKLLNKLTVLANCSIALILLFLRFDLFDSFISIKQIRFSSNKTQSHL